MLKNCWKLRELLKFMGIHDMKCLFKTGFYKIIPHLGYIGPNEKRHTGISLTTLTIKHQF